MCNVGVQGCGSCCLFPLAGGMEEPVTGAAGTHLSTAFKDGAPVCQHLRVAVLVMVNLQLLRCDLKLITLLPARLRSPLHPAGVKNMQTRLVHPRGLDECFPCGQEDGH